MVFARDLHDDRLCSREKGLSSRLARVKVAYWVLRSSLLVGGIAVVLFYMDGLVGFVWHYIGNFGPKLLLTSSATYSIDMFVLSGTPAYYRDVR